MKNSDDIAEEIDLYLLWQTIWQKRLLIATSIIVCFALGIIYLHRATFQYTAQLLVTPAPSNGSSGGARLGGLSGLASMAGIRLPNSEEVSPFQLYIASLKTREIADGLFRDTDLVHAVFSSEWDAKNQRWLRPAGSLTMIKRMLKTALGIPNYSWQPPDGARLQQYLEGAVEIEQNNKTPVVIIRMNHSDPKFATRFLKALHTTADEHLRRKALVRSTEYIHYLSEKLVSIGIVEHRMAIAQALSEQEKTRMMTSSTVPFAAEPFGPPSASARPTSPAPLMVLIVSIFAGLFIGIAIAVSINLSRK